MKKKKLMLLLAVMLTIPLWMNAQSIQITNFARNNSLIGSMNTVYDNSGVPCAVIQFWHSGSDYIIVPNLGYMKIEEHPGETRIWVPVGTKRITIRHRDDKPLRSYSIPVRIESKVAYDATIEIVGTGKTGPVINETHPVYIGAGFNVLSIMGPSLALGFDMDHHNIELGAVYGLNKTDDLYFYDSNSNVKAAYNYKALRVQLRYGYEIEATDFLSIVPQVGAAYNFINGTDVGTSSNDNYKSAGSLSVLGAIRFVASLNEYIKLQITPEYDFGVYKNKNCKTINNFDNTFKSWTDGFNLNVGVMVFF